MRFLPLLLLALSACLPQSANTDATDMGMAVSGSGSAGSHGGANAFANSLPSVAYGENILVQEDRTYRVLGKDGLWDVFFEELRADGNGEFLLSLSAVAFDDAPVSSIPNMFWTDLYATRGRYLVHFRDPHLGEDNIVRFSYSWNEIPGFNVIAGRKCLQYRAESRFGFGSLEIYLDNQNNHLLGWKRFDPADALAAEMEVTSVDFAPTFTNQAWSQPLASERDYDPLNDDVLLGITPQPAVYLPLGFNQSRIRFVDAERAFGTMVPNIYFEHYTDGIQNLLIAQSRLLTSPSPQATINFANRTDLGGVRVVEGVAGARQIYVIGSLPRQELLAVFGAMD